MWCTSRVFDNNPTHVLLFYWSELDRQQPIQIFFFLTFYFKKLNFTELLFFNILETYLQHIM